MDIKSNISTDVLDARIVRGTSPSVANGDNFALPTGSGFLIISEDTVTGEVMDVSYCANTYTAIRQVGTLYVQSASPAAGKVGFAFSSGAYRIFNNSGSARVFSYSLTKVRPNN